MSNRTEFRIKNHTQAPLRLELKASFSVSPQTLFTTVSDHHAVVNWVPLMKAVSMEHHRGSNGECGIGSVRHCTLNGMGGIDETIAWWNPPYGYAYKVAARSKMMMPTRDHVSVMRIEPTADGGSTLTWQHYFNWRGLFMRHMTALMLPMMMKTALGNLRKALGEKEAAACHADAAGGTEACQRTCGK